jgi:hypothetical protein
MADGITPLSGEFSAWDAVYNRFGRGVRGGRLHPRFAFATKGTTLGARMMTLDVRGRRQDYRTTIGGIP